MENNSQLCSMLGATKLEAFRNFCNINITFKETALEDASQEKRLKVMAGWIPLLETIFASPSLGSKHHRPGFSRTTAGC